MIVYKICGCGQGYNPNETSHSCVISRSCRRTAQLPEGERPVVWEHPETGEVRYPGHTGNMPGYYKDQGYQRKEFNSYFEHKKWCDEHGVVNHAIEGIKDEALKG